MQSPERKDVVLEEAVFWEQGRGDLVSYVATKDGTPSNDREVGLE